MKILAIDLATRTGWASAWPGGQSSGVLELKPASAIAGKAAVPPKLAKRDGRVLRPGRPPILAVEAEPEAARFGKLLAWLYASATRMDVIVSEAPLKHHKGARAAEIALGLAGVLRAFAHWQRVRHVEIDPYDLQRFALGKKADTKQDEMLHEARRRLGYAGTDDNEADALHLLAWAREHVAPQAAGGAA